ILVIEREAELGSQVSIVECGDAKVESRRRPLSLRRINSDGFRGDGQCGLRGELTQLDGKDNTACRSAGLKDDVIVRTEVAHDIFLVDLEGRGSFPGGEKSNCLGRAHAGAGGLNFDINLA